jgi:hypothetical protein
MFGNPFKLVSKDQKSSMFGADEIDEVMEESNENNNQFQKPQQQQQQSAKRSVIGGPASKRRGGLKGPLSKRINYLKNLYTTNTSSSASFTGSESDMEYMDESASSLVTSFTTSDKSYVSDATTPDVANLNDFNETEVEMQPVVEPEEIKQERPISAISMISSSESGAMIDTDLCDNHLEQSYVQLKILCIEQIKKPAKDHSSLFKMIYESPLTLRLRQFLVKELVYEAARFKRLNLINSMNKFSTLMQQIADKSRSSATPKNERVDVNLN